MDHKKDRIKIESKKSVRGNLIIRAEGPIEWPSIDIERCKLNKGYQKDWDLNQDSSQNLRIIGAGAHIYHKKIKRKLVVAPRDFVANVITNQEPDGSIYMLGSTDN